MSIDFFSSKYAIFQLYSEWVNNIAAVMVLHLYEMIMMSTLYNIDTLS